MAILINVLSLPVVSSRITVQVDATVGIDISASLPLVLDRITSRVQNMWKAFPEKALPNRNQLVRRGEKPHNVKYVGRLLFSFYYSVLPVAMAWGWFESVYPVNSIMTQN